MTMITKKIDNDNFDIEGYIGDEYAKCLYLYLDYKKYGLNNMHINFWYQADENDKIHLLILKYYSGMHLYSKNNDFDKNQLIELINKEKPSLICGEKSIIENIQEALNDIGYQHEYGFVRELSKVAENIGNDVIKAHTDEDLKSITNLLISDPICSSYTFEDLFNQIIERNHEGYGRNYIIKNENEIVAHAGTGAEDNKVAMLNYVITNPKYRKCGYATIICNALCSDLIKEGKKVYLINYTNESTKLYDKLGFKVSCEWGKLFKE